MQVVTPEVVKGKKVLLRLDLDVPLGKGTEDRLQAFGSEAQTRRVTEDFRLRACIPTLKLCLEHAAEVTILGHIGRPDGVVVKELSVEPVKEWLEKSLGRQVNLLENLRFDPREELMDEGFAKELAKLGDFYVNEAFASYRPSVSTTILPKLLSHAAGLHFAKEVQVLTEIRDNPKKPFVAIMGGAKVKDKLPVIEVLAKKADAVLVGGKLVAEIKEQHLDLAKNVMMGKLNEDGFDIAPETVSAWSSLIASASQIIWNGPVGKFEDPKNDATKKIAELVLDSGAKVAIGGGDSIAALNQYGLLEKAETAAFVSVGGGAMLKFLVDGTLPTIEALK